jgi:transposase
MSLRVHGCRDCLRKSIEIDELKAENARLRQDNARLRKQLGKEHRVVTEPPFGSATPSSKQPLKPNSLEENQRRRGGARPGHPGHGRKPPPPDERIELPLPDCCPDCGGPLDLIDWRDRRVVDALPLRVVGRCYRFAHQRCRRCGRSCDAPIPEVLPKAMLSNRLIAVVATEHYLHGVPMGQVARRTGLGEGTLFNAMHQLARRLGDAPDRVAEQLRQAPCKHADETPWRTDGANGYAWFFGNHDSSLFRFGLSRAGSVVTEVLGKEPLPGTLVVDRYSGYNVSPCPLQYCYAHLLRNLQDLHKDCPDNAEVTAFVQTLAPLLADAMHLPGERLDTAAYYARANRLKQQILDAISHSARHLAVQNYQTIFRQHRQRLFHWVDDRRIPPDNNFAERALRPTVIARKLSFGSQSNAGANTRSILMTTLHTLAKRVPSPTDALRDALNTLILNPAANLSHLLFPPHSNDG